MGMVFFCFLLSKSNYFIYNRNMKKTEFPLRKTFKKEVLILKKWKIWRRFDYSYKQATISEFHEFFWKSQEEQITELYDEIHRQIPLSHFERFLSIFFNIRWKIERNIDIEKEIFEMMENKFRTYQSIFSWTQEGSWWPSLYSANVAIICQKYCISPIALFEGFTIEQYIWLQDGVIFLANSADENWKIENKKAVTDKEAIKKRAEATRQAFESKK